MKRSWMVTRKRKSKPSGITLSLGTSAADPPGIRRVDTVLSVDETARTYRGRSSVAGFRGIAVGFPERISYAFNAETGTLSAIWQGDFIRVDRGGQGSGGFNPSAPSNSIGSRRFVCGIER